VAVSRARAVCLVFGDREVARSCGIPHIVALLDHVARRERPGRPKDAKPFQSPWEERLYEALLARGVRTVPQFPVAGRFLDLAVPEVRLDIEVDGDFHRGPDGYRRTEDRWRDLQLRAAGWQVNRFWVYELKEDLDGCVERVLARVRELQSRAP
jgi:very-short-patch-repair endonuclease